MPATESEPALAKPPIPQPGYWRPMQSMNGRVLQYAWTCLCGKTYYMLCSRHMDVTDKILEHCDDCMEEGQKKKFLDDRACRPCDGEGLVCKKCGRSEKKCLCFKAGKKKKRQTRRCLVCDGSGVAPIAPAESSGV